MSTVEIIFWSFAFMVFYAYAGYPIILKALSYVQGHSTKDIVSAYSGTLPRVTLLISAYNEDKVIEGKILNSLSLNYPKELLEILVISDGSDDSTNEIVLRYAEKGVILKQYEGRIGKTACLNRTVPIARGEIIVFSDANSEYDSNALMELVKHFSNPAKGFVTGWTKYRTGKEGDGAGPVGMYAKLELLIKLLESHVGSCVGADGAIFAIRKRLYQPLSAYDINDFVIPLSIIKQGYRGVLEKKAFCFEKAADDDGEEFNRQVRITNRTIRAIMNYKALLNPVRYGFFSFTFFSHKLCRFFVPFSLLVLLATGAFLATRNDFYLTLLAGQLFFYATAGITSGDGKETFMTRACGVSRAFIMVNIAILLAWFKFFQGVTYTTWTPTQR